MDKIFLYFMITSMISIQTKTNKAIVGDYDRLKKPSQRKTHLWDLHLQLNRAVSKADKTVV